MKIEITGMKAKDLEKLGDHLKGNWRVKCLTDPKDKTKDRVFLISEDEMVRVECVKEVI